MQNKIISLNGIYMVYTYTLPMSDTIQSIQFFHWRQIVYAAQGAIWVDLYECI